MADKVFADGLIVKRHLAAPEWATCKLSVKVDEFIAFLNQNQDNGWVNIEVNRGQTGKYYAALDTWKPNTQTHPQQPQQDRTFPDDEIPFG